MKETIKQLLHFLSLFLVSPCGLLCLMEKWISEEAEGVFLFWTQCFSLLPGLPGLFLRRAFYCQTLERCSPNVFIGFGTLFSHREVRLADEVYIGPYCLIGSVDIDRNCFIGSRVSLLSGKHQHGRDENGRWMVADRADFVQISIGYNVWIGEGAIVMDSVASGSQVAAGSLVNKPVPANVTVAGNPAKVVRNFTGQVWMVED